MFKQYESLKKLDSVIVSKNEFDNVLVWNERLFAKQTNKLKKLRPKDPKAPPEKEDEDSKNGVPQTS